jgi:4-amino-4-deoxy-L-arabinose transferase-like glycosyltransferase
LDAAAARGDVVAQWSIEAHQPPLYYALGALLISATSRDDITGYLRSNDLIFTWGRREGNHNQWLHPPTPPRGDTHRAIWTLRLFSLALACGTLWCIYRAAHLATGSAAVALTAMLTTASIPTFAAISASANNDNLVTFLSAAAVFWTLHAMRHGLRKYDWALIALIVSAIALTKFTGLSVVAVIALGLWFAVRHGTITRQQAFTVLGAIALFTALNAGWWYARNWSLYGDPLALEATQALWGRDFAVASESGGLMAEIPRIWQSFWLMIGHLHQPVWGPLWFYAAVLLVCGLAVIGWVMTRVFFTPHPQPLSHSGERSAIWVLALAALLPVGLLVYGTRTVDISYGRLLFPGLVGIVPLLVMGWRRLFGRFAVICALPLLVMTVVMPYTLIRPAYPALEAVTALPESAIPLNIRTDEGLTILGYEPLPRLIEQFDAPPLTIYLSGNDARNPALTVSWLSPVKAQNIGQITVYPGMSPTDALAEDAIYRAVVPTARLFSGCDSCDIDTGLLRLELKWQTDGISSLPTTLSDGQAAPIVLDGPVYVDAGTIPADDVLATFGTAIRLLDVQMALRNDVLDLRLQWMIDAVPPPDLTLTVQIFDAAGEFVMNADGEIAGYPARVWIPGTAVIDERLIELPDDLSAGTYTVTVGWYTRGDLARLPVSAETARDNLAVIGTFEVIIEEP